MLLLAWTRNVYHLPNSKITRQLFTRAMAATTIPHLAIPLLMQRIKIKKDISTLNVYRFIHCPRAHILYGYQTSQDIWRIFLILQHTSPTPSCVRQIIFLSRNFSKLSLDVTAICLSSKISESFLNLPVSINKIHPKYIVSCW